MKTAQQDILVFNVGTGFALISALDKQIAREGRAARKTAMRLRTIGNHAEAEFQGYASAQGIQFLIDLRNQIAAQVGENETDGPVYSRCPVCGAEAGCCNH